ncbi:hypothetical protein TNIN_336501 [Trichonephila inaurata madagascariensis]|uniref:Uncharacterized protein n=1 Tax=Trichonephila inaurata madagascariensis TaxID=2747483 RepID=A0A8X6YBI6_9ARAC|nr:hypothetical protein TNIN_336501 [Trichonephila inaurata madagascariensis]
MKRVGGNCYEYLNKTDPGRNYFKKMTCLDDFILERSFLEIECRLSGMRAVLQVKRSVGRHRIGPSFFSDGESDAFVARFRVFVLYSISFLPRSFVLETDE